MSGLDAGADDYVPKPFSARELVARVKSVLRRRKMMAKRRMSNVMTFEGLQIDLGTGLGSIDGAQIKLSRTEFLILALLLRHRGRFFSRAEIRDEAWDSSEPGSDDVSERTVDTNISRLRKNRATTAPTSSTVRATDMHLSTETILPYCSDPNLGNEAGCDEAGRGCLAGPVCAAAVILPPTLLCQGLRIQKIEREATP